MRWGYVARNIAASADLPKGMAPEMHVWSPEQLRVFLNHARQDRLYAAWLLFATTGMRRGEVAGLRWSDVALEAGRVSPRRPRVVNYEVHVSEPKTAKGRRSLALDPATVAALRQHRARQAEERLAVGPRWRDSGLVFTWPDGRPLHPERFSKWFEQLARAAARRASDCTTCVTATRPRRWPPASRPRWSASASATPTSPSPWTPTATSCPAWMPRPLAPWPGSSWATWSKSRRVPLTKR
jgi:integrase